MRSLLEEMIERDASDLHITAGERAKLRVDGDIVDSNCEVNLSPKDTLQLAYSVLTENQKKRFEMDDELDFSFGLQNLAHAVLPPITRNAILTARRASCLEIQG